MALRSPAVAALRPSASPSAMATPPVLSPPQAGPIGLRRPSDPHALRSLFLTPSAKLLLSLPRAAGTVAPKFLMRVAAQQAYICRDCGYIYNERTPFEKLPDKYFCPVCGAPKRRFRAYEPEVARNANNAQLRLLRKSQLKRDEAVGRALPVAVAAGVAGLAVLYYYLSTVY